MCLQTVYFLVLFSHLRSMLRVLMKVLSHASAKKKTKAKNKNFKFRILAGHFQATSWQWKGWIYNNSTGWSTHTTGHNHFNLASGQNASTDPRGHACSQANLDIFLLAHMKNIIADAVVVFCSLVWQDLFPIPDLKAQKSANLYSSTSCHE